MRSRQYGKGSTCAASRPFSPSSRPERVASSARADPPPPAASTDGTGGRAPPPRENKRFSTRCARNLAYSLPCPASSESVPDVTASSRLGLGRRPKIFQGGNVDQDILPTKIYWVQRPRYLGSCPDQDVLGPDQDI